MTSVTTRACQRCGGEFVGRSDARFCGDACRQAARRARGRSGGSRVVEPAVDEAGVVVDRGAVENVRVVLETCRERIERARLMQASPGWETYFRMLAEAVADLTG